MTDFNGLTRAVVAGYRNPDSKFTTGQRTG